MNHVFRLGLTRVNPNANLGRWEGGDAGAAGGSNRTPTFDDCIQGEGDRMHVRLTRYFVYFKAFMHERIILFWPLPICIAHTIPVCMMT